MADEKQKRTYPQPGPQPATPAERPTERLAEAPPGAKALLAHLQETGTPADRLAPVAKVLEQNKAATAEEGYRALEEAKVPTGTLRKAGKFAFGPGFEPTAGPQPTMDELVELRTENENLRRALAAAEATRISLIRQRDMQAERLNDLQAQLKLLKPKLTPEELDAAGIH